jgi:hypothetical protein
VQVMQSTQGRIRVSPTIAIKGRRLGNPREVASPLRTRIHGARPQRSLIRLVFLVADALPRCPADFSQQLPYCGCGAQAERLAGEAALPEESPSFRMPMVASVPNSRYNGEFYFSFLNIKDRIGRTALSEDRLFFGKRFNLSTVLEGRKEYLRIKLEEFLGRCPGCHNRLRQRVPSDAGPNAEDE